VFEAWHKYLSLLPLVHSFSVTGLIDADCINPERNIIIAVTDVL
jgi:hypothetical protein